MILKVEKRMYLEQNFPSAALSNVNPTWTGLGWYLGLCFEKLMTKKEISLKERILRSQKNKHWKCNFENHIWQNENSSWLHVFAAAFQEQWLWKVYHENYKSGFIFQLCNCMLVSNMNVTIFSFQFYSRFNSSKFESSIWLVFMAQRFYKLHNQCQPESQMFFL